MADDLSLLFRLRGDAASLKQASSEGRAAINQLKQSFGPELSQTVNVANRAFSEIGENLNVFVGQRIPLAGGMFIRITEHLRNFGREAAVTDRAVKAVATSIAGIARESGKSVPEITSFLTRFIQIEGQAKRDAAAIDFFGASLGTKLIPQLEKTGAEMAKVAVAAEGTGAAMAGVAGPVGIAVLAIIAATAATALLGKELFGITKNAAEFQGKMFDLSQQTGIEVETLSALEIVAKTTGGEIGNLTQSLIAFQRKLEEAQDPQSKAAESFRKLGVEANDTETALRNTLAALARMPQGFQQTNAAAELFGSRGGKQMLAILKEADGDLDAVIAKARELGILIDTDAARTADKFNDELALLEFQLRAASAEMAKELIPAFLQVIRAFGDLVRASRPFLSALGEIAGPVVESASKALRGLGLAVAVLTQDYRALAEAAKNAREEVAGTIPALQIPAIQPTALPGPKSAQDIAREAALQADAIVAAAKRSANEQNQILQELFQKGRIRREQEAESVIRSNRTILQSEQARIDALINQKNEEARVLDKEGEAYRKLSDEIGRLQTERLDKESAFEVQSRAIRAKANKERADSLRNQVKNETEILLAEFDRQIKRTDELDVIEQLERAKIGARRDALEEQKRIGFLTVEDQREINNQLIALGQEEDQLREDQQRRRLEREREAAEEVRQIKLAEIDTLIQLQQIGGQRLIDIIKSLADARVLTEEEAARRITQVRLDLIDQEIEATKAKLKSTTGVADLKERARLEAELNSQLKILQAERTSIQVEGNRDIEQGRRDDVENERRYANELRRIRERIADIEREAAQEIIAAMIANFASRRDILRARLQLDIQDEQERHTQALAEINALRTENAESNRTQEEKNRITEELNRLAESEAKRHRLAMKAITDQGKKDEATESPIGQALEALRSGQLPELENGLRSFADVATVALGSIFAAVGQLSQGFGQLVQQWVLMGNVGPNAFRKLAATILASVAQQAAALAIMSLAYAALATTAVGAILLGGTPAQFLTAAALFGAVATVAAIAGRGVAGNLFRPQTATGGTGSGRGGSGQGGSSELSPIDITRSQQREEIHIFLHGEPGPGFSDAVINTFVSDVQRNGVSRQVIVHTAETG